MSSEPFLDAAAAIARRLCADAIWHEGVCCWVGPTETPAIISRPEYRAVGPWLYNGTAGIGLFLAQYAAALGDGAARRTAAGALRHAVAHAPDGDGLHAGALGCAWAAARGGAQIGDDALTADARARVDAWLAARPPEPDGPDLVDGGSGSLVALLALAAQLDDQALLDPARGLGEHLLATVTRTRHGCSWGHPRRRSRRHLCGVAHGAGGIAGALLELYGATGEVRFRDAAEAAFAYERSWLDAQAGTWPDLRLPARRGGPVAESAITATWCYGEAGIALRRLRAKDLLGDGPHCPDANIALATTRRRLTAALPYAIDDLTLCHGLGGAAEALLAAGDREPAIGLGEVALSRHGRRGDWPCGSFGIGPGLFLGTSGVGWLFLRLHDAGIPSPLRG